MDLNCAMTNQLGFNKDYIESCSESKYIKSNMYKLDNFILVY